MYRKILVPVRFFWVGPNSVGNRSLTASLDVGRIPNAGRCIRGRGQFSYRGTTNYLLQLCILRFGLLQDRNVRVGVFPVSEEILVGGAGGRLISGERCGSAQLQPRQRTEHV